MTRQQTFKRRIRSRMAKTGESYTTARRQLLATSSDLFAEQTADVPAPGEAPARRSPADDARRRLLDRRRAWVLEATARTMDEWIGVLDGAGARELSHHEIWRWLADSGHVTEGDVREGITITYEQEIGRREIGQSCYGDYPASVTRVVRGTLDGVLEQWLALVGDTHTFNGARLASEPAVSATEKFRYWRAKLTDGTSVSATIWQMPDGRISVGVQHRAFPDRAAADACKAYWKELLGPLRVGQKQSHHGAGGSPPEKGEEG